MSGGFQGGSRAQRRTTWRTPRYLFLQLDAEFGFTLDAAACDESALAPTHIDISLDALEQPWPGVVFCNPPYGQREIPKWILKGWNEAAKGSTVVFLVPSRTDTTWWHDYALRGEVRFIRGRLKFEGATNRAPFPSAVIIFRPPGALR